MIQVTHLTKHYGTTTAVDDLSFDVRPGIVTGFLGPNGAGKSTTMRIILGLDRPSGGTATVNGRRLAVLRGEVVLEDAGGGCPAERSVGSVMIVEVDEAAVAVASLGL